MKKKVFSLTGAALLVLTSVSGCVISSPQMAVPRDIGDRYELIAVTERSVFSGALADESFTLGKYRIKDVTRGWTTTESTGIGHFSKQEGANEYAFSFVADGSTTKAICKASANGKAVDVGSGWSLGNSYSGVECSCGANSRVEISNALSDREDAIQINIGGNERLAATKEYEDSAGRSYFTQKYSGKLAVSGVTYRISSLHKTEQGMKSPLPMGYRVENRDQVLGLVEIERPGRVWLNKSSPATVNSKLSCLFAGLMLYQPVDDSPTN